MVVDTLTSMILFERSLKFHVVCLDWFVGSDYLFLASESGHVYIFDVKKGYIFHHFESHSGRCDL